LLSSRKRAVKMTRTTAAKAAGQIQNWRKWARRPSGVVAPPKMCSP
jgi:hypothetical protein